MDEDFDLGGFDEAYDTDDFSQAEMDFASAIGAETGGFGDDNTSQTIANFTAQPQVGLNRSNITGSKNFDPTFAAALDISRGLDPTLNLGGTGGLTVPSYLRPQIPGEFMTTPLGEADMVRPMFFSQGEKFLQQTLPEIIQSGPTARIARGIGDFFGNIFSEGKEFAKDATAGLKLPSLNEISQGFTNFMDRFRPRETDTNPMNMPMAAIRDEVPQFNYGNIPSGFTFGSMPMNTGIASVDPRAAQNANRNVAEAIKDLQLIPEGTLADSIGVRNQVAQALDPELKAFIDRQPSINQRMTELGDERSVRQIQENANKIRRDAIEAYKNPNTRLSNNLTMHIERFKIRNR